MPAVVNPLWSQAGTDWRGAVIGPGICIGSFLGTLVDFLIMAFVLYRVIRPFERLKLKQATDAEPPVEAKLNDSLTRLTDCLASRGGR